MAYTFLDLKTNVRDYTEVDDTVLTDAILTVSGGSDITDKLSVNYFVAW